MRKIKQTIYIFMFIVFFFILTSCDDYHILSTVDEFADDVVNQKISEFEIEFNNMYDKLVEYNILPSSLDKNYSKKQEFNGKTYYFNKPSAFPSLDYVEDKYFLESRVEFEFSIEYENFNVRLTKKYYFNNKTCSYSLFFYNYSNTKIGYEDLSFDKFRNELNFFNDYLSLNKDLVSELNEYFNYKYFVEDFDINKISSSLQRNKVMKRISFSLSPLLRLEYTYSISQNINTLLYDNCFGISYHINEEDIK